MQLRTLSYYHGKTLFSCTVAGKPYINYSYAVDSLVYGSLDNIQAPGLKIHGIKITKTLTTVEIQKLRLRRESWKDLCGKHIMSLAKKLDKNL